VSQSIGASNELTTPSLPPGAIPGDEFFSKEPQCQTCFHFESEHLEGTNHCTRTIAYMPDADITKIEKGQKNLIGIHPRQKCDCKHFVAKETS